MALLGWECRTACQRGALEVERFLENTCSTAGPTLWLGTLQAIRGVWRLPGLGGEWGMGDAEVRLPPLPPNRTFAEVYEVRCTPAPYIHAR